MINQLSKFLLLHFLSINVSVIHFRTNSCYTTLYVVTSVSNWLIRTRTLCSDRPPTSDSWHLDWIQIHFLTSTPQTTWNSKDLSLSGLWNHISNCLFVTLHFTITSVHIWPPLCPSSRPVWPCSSQRFARGDNDTRVRLGVFVLLRGRGEFSCWVSSGRPVLDKRFI